jgi:hypothetical protein
VVVRTSLRGLYRCGRRYRSGLKNPGKSVSASSGIIIYKFPIFSVYRTRRSCPFPCQNHYRPPAVLGLRTKESQMARTRNANSRNAPA